MIGKCNVGTNKNYANILVYFPPEEVCYCQYNNIILQSNSINGRYLFNIPKNGRWRVYTSSGLEIFVDIVEERQLEIRTLVHTQLFLYKDGDQCTNTTGGWGINFQGDYQIISPEYESTNIYFAGNNDMGKRVLCGPNLPIDVTNFKKMCFYYLISQVYQSGQRYVCLDMGLYNNRYLDDEYLVGYYQSNKPATTEDYGEIDLSNITGMVNLAINVGVSTNCKGRLRQVFLIP